MLAFLAAAYLLAALALHFTKPRRNYRSRPVTEMASEVRAGLETLARALCCQAVTGHARNVGELREYAAVLWLDVLNDFGEVKISPETRDWLAALFKIDPKAMGKQVPGK